MFSPEFLASCFFIAMLAFALFTGYMVCFGANGVPMLFAVAAPFAFILAAVLYVGVFFLGWGGGVSVDLLASIRTFAFTILCGIPAFALFSAVYHKDGGHSAFCGFVIFVCLLCAAVVWFVR